MGFRACDCTERLRSQVCLIWQRGGLKEELIAVCSYLKGSYRDNRAKLFSSDRQYKALVATNCILRTSGGTLTSHW